MSWKDQGDYDEFMQKKDPEDKFGKPFISGEQFDARHDAMTFERYPLRIFTHRRPAGKPGMTYYDEANDQFEIFTNETGGWAKVQMTTTSSSSSTSTSTSTTTTL